MFKASGHDPFLFAILDNTLSEKDAVAVHVKSRFGGGFPDVSRSEQYLWFNPHLVLKQKQRQDEASADYATFGFGPPNDAPGWTALPDNPFRRCQQGLPRGRVAQIGQAFIARLGHLLCAASIAARMARGAGT